MPKENIGSQEHGSISVSWGKDHGDVQISIAGPIGWRKLTEVDADNGLDWHWHPNRFEINKLIRTLRRARDQAMGRDE